MREIPKAKMRNHLLDVLTDCYPREELVRHCETLYTIYSFFFLSGPVTHWSFFFGGGGRVTLWGCQRARVREVHSRALEGSCHMQTPLEKPGAAEVENFFF